MENITPLRRHGLFDASVPRYTSYPPANHFRNDVGQRNQLAWLSQVQEGEAVSIYIHIPFCKRLCWFCACRTQGTKTLRPVDAYVEVLKEELKAIRQRLPADVKMGRLHLGGGTPTILSPQTMSSLLALVFAEFETTLDFEFSVEIDPTEAQPRLLQTLINFGMNRASMGVQDFATKVQEAIGRPQSLDETTTVLNFLRNNGIKAVNMDLLYGLPFQTKDSFRRTLDHVRAMSPDRLAIYGYAHVPWMSKRQVLIKDDTLPTTQDRFELANIAHDVLTADGYHAIGIDHFAKSTDSLYKFMKAGKLKRNFQGYTDDQSDTLIGLGASAISRFKGGYQQNAVSTSAYQERVADSGFAGHKGYDMRPNDHLIASMIEQLMCNFAFPTQALKTEFPDDTAKIHDTAVSLMQTYPDVFTITPEGLSMRKDTWPLVRIVANHIDTFATDGVAHAAAI